MVKHGGVAFKNVDAATIVDVNEDAVVPADNNVQETSAGDCVNGDTWWVPLPSRFFKMGKTVDPLDKIFPSIFRRQDHQEATARAAYQFLSEVSHGYAFFASTPFFDHFLKHFPLKQALSHRTDHLFEYKIKAAAGWKPIIDLEFYWCQLANRYNVSVEQLQESLKYLPTDIFQISCHPVFQAMAAADYY